MAAKKQTAAQAKAAKQKKLAIGGAVLLIGVLVIQGPKMLKMLTGGSSGSAAPAVAPVPVPVPGVTPTPTPASPVPTAPSGTKLVSFERFSSKDPFTVQLSNSAPSASTGSTGAAAAAVTATATQSPGVGVTLVPKATTSSSSSSSTATPTKTGTMVIQTGGGTTGTYAKLEVNGKSETVSKGKDFPKADPTFTLTGIDGQSVTVAIAGGSLKTGGKSFTLDMNEPKTLLNTADNKRYTLVLLSVQAPN